MASFGTLSLATVVTASVTFQTPNTAPVTYQEMSVQQTPNTDYVYLAGVVGQSLVAATGGDPIEVSPTGPSGAFDTQRVTAIIGQQIAAAVSAH